MFVPRAIHNSSAWSSLSPHLIWHSTRYLVFIWYRKTTRRHRHSDSWPNKCVFIKIDVYSFLDHKNICRVFNCTGPFACMFATLCRKMVFWLLPAHWDGATAFLSSVKINIFRCDERLSIRPSPDCVGQSPVGKVRSARWANTTNDQLIVLWASSSFVTRFPTGLDLSTGLQPDRLSKCS